MLELLRITVQHHDFEDRIRRVGEAAEGSILVMWMTQRLVNNLVPALLNWLEGRTDHLASNPALMGFEQDAARAGLTPQSPVEAPSDEDGWLVQAVDLKPAADSIQLLFRPARPDQPPAFLVMNATAMRQWLGILHDQCKRAGWPMKVWPAWMNPAAISPATSTAWIN